MTRFSKSWRDGKRLTPETALKLQVRQGLAGPKNPSWKGGKVDLTCQICGKEYKRFPNDAAKSKYCSRKCTGQGKIKTKVQLKCKTCGKKFEDFPSGYSRKYCSNRCCRITRKGRLLKWTLPELEVVRQKLKDGWETKEIARLFNKNENTTQDLIQRQGWASKMGSNDFRMKCSKRNKKLWSDPNHFFHTVEYKNKTTAHHKDPTHTVNSLEYRQILSDRAFKNKSWRLNQPIKTGRILNCHGGIRQDLGFYVRSGWEANIARYLKWLKTQNEIEDFNYEADTFEFPVKKGNRSYTPDFKVKNKNGTIEYWEVKGYMDSDSQTKIKRFGKYYPDLKLQIIDKNQYKEIKKYARLIGEWE